MHSDVKFIRFLNTLGKDRIKGGKGVVHVLVGKADTHGKGFTRLHHRLHMRCHLRANVSRIDLVHAPLHDRLMNAIFDIRRRVDAAPQALLIGLIFGKEELRSRMIGHIDKPPTVAQMPVASADRVDRLARRGDPFKLGTRPAIAPRPIVAIPDLGQQMDRRCGQTTVDGSDAAQNILLITFGIFDENIKVAPLLESIRQGINQFKFRRQASPVTIFLLQPAIGVGHLGIFVEHFGIAVGWRVV